MDSRYVTGQFSHLENETKYLFVDERNETSNTYTGRELIEGVKINLSKDITYVLKLSDTR